MKFEVRRHLASIVIAVVSIVMIIAIGFLIVVATRALPAVEGTVATIENTDKKPTELAWPGQGQAAIGTLDGGLKTAIGDDTPRPIASIAKVITALVILDAKPIEGDGPLITMTADDVALLRQTIASNGSHLYITEGEQLSQRQMVEAMMLPSANNIADGLAVWAFGGMDNYRSTAEAWLIKHGLNHTTIGADASGLDPGTTSTTADLFEIGRLALQNPTLRNIVREPMANFPIEGDLLNNNQLLRDGSGYIGIKTGNSDQALSCLLFASEHTVGGSRVTIIGVLLEQNFGTTFDKARALNQSAADNLVEYKIPAGTTVGQYQTPWGATVQAITTSSISGVIWRDENPSPDVVLDYVTPPAHNDPLVGGASLGNQATDVKLGGVLSAPNLWWKIKNLPTLQW
ncbi:hypothetical protein FACS189431_3390 [Alphaproteobacteria bacterium]|nr:hypothetical protein FACS189431_3390 [Alphaproteobacteria bacterium]